MAKQYTIYTLIDPRDGWPYYIGYTNNPEHRRQGHEERTDGITAVVRRNQEIIRAKHRLEMRFLEKARSRMEARIKEMFWIDLFISRGIDLCNRENQAWLIDGFDEEVTDLRLAWKASKPKGKQQPKRQGQRWIEEELAELEQRREANESVHAIAKALGRSERAVEMQLQKLGHKVS